MALSDALNTTSSAPLAGAAAIDITPRFPVFLYGYPHVMRESTGTHNPLFATALFLDDGEHQGFVISVDVIWLSKQQVARTRRRIADATGVAADHILISATHTHSGPSTVQILSNANDRAVPAPDPRIVAQIEDGIVAAAVRAKHNAIVAELGFGEAEVPGIGGNRHTASGPSLPRVPIVVVRSAAEKKTLLALFYVFNVHPTVLHEDSTLISGDFPGLARRHLQSRLSAANSCLPVLQHLGPAGDQSPRNVVRANTVQEVERLGVLLGTSIEEALTRVKYLSDWDLHCARTFVELPLRCLPSPEKAAADLAELQSRFEHLQVIRAPSSVVRTAECDCFGAEEVNALVAAATDGRLAEVARQCMPAEIQLLRIGPRWLVAWPGEIFVEFAQQLYKQFPQATIITLANGELQGYLTTAEAVEGRWYEASNAIFDSPDSGEALVESTVRLLQRLAEVRG